MDERKSEIVIIPAYNEEKSLPVLIKSVLKEVSSVIVVDDGSTDNTSKIAEESGALVVRNESNLGKGSSIINGILWCMDNGYEPVIVMDADGQHSSDKIKDFMRVYKEEKADLILGNRMKKADNMPFIRLTTNRFMSWFTSILLGLRLHDTQCGYRLIGKRAMELHRDIIFRCQRFDYESEVLFYAVKKGFKILEVDIPTIYDSERKSRIHPVKDTLRWIKALFVIRKNAAKI